MSSATEHRKLTAIMFTDMVGYSALAQRNEALALELLQEHRRLLRPIFPQFNGREVETAGDAFLVEFASALEATRCAVEIQRTLSERNQVQPAERYVRLRIGIHVGDVVHKDGKVMGDAVNIAARIEPLADQGGICVTRAVFEQIENKVPQRLIPLSKPELKNISANVEVYKLVLSDPVVSESARKSRKLLAAIVLFVVTLNAVLFLKFGLYRKQDDAAATNSVRAATTNASAKASASTSVAGPKSIAVLAFANLSDDKANEYFSDGISEELLNILAKVPGLKVSARTSAFYFKGRNVPVDEIAKQLGVAYLVEGSVRKSGGRVRITAQLIKAADGFHVWSDNFDRELKDIFAVQDEIAGLIAQNLQLKLGDDPRVTKAVDPEAHRLLLEGRHFLTLRTAEGFDQAERAFTAALKIDWSFAQAQAGLADTTALRRRYRLLDGVITRMDESGALALAQSRLALQMDPSLAGPHATIGFLLNDAWQLAEAEQAFQKAFAADANYATAYHWHSHVEAAQGRLDLALREIERAESLDPLSFIILYIHGMYLSDARQDAKALAIFDRAAALRSERFLPLEGDRARVLFALGRREEAITAARKLLQDPAILSAGWFAAAEALYVLQQGGTSQEAREAIGALLPRIPAGSYQRGLALCAVGNYENGLAQLENLPALACNRLYWSPMMDPVRETPAFQQLLAQLNFTEQYKIARATLARMLSEKDAKK